MHDHAKSKWTEAHILAKQQLALLSSNNTASKPKEIKVAFCFLALVISQLKMWLCLITLRENQGTGARIQLDKTAEPVSLHVSPSCQRNWVLGSAVKFSQVNVRDWIPGHSIWWIKYIVGCWGVHAVLLKSRLGYLQWDRKGFQRKVQVNQTYFPTGCLSKA